MRVFRNFCFGRDEKGSSVVEFALLAPVLLLLLLGTVTLFDLFRTQQSVEKATFTIGDMVSREQTMNQTKLNAMLTLLRNIVPSADDGGLRISSVIKSGGRLRVVWSKPVGLAVPDSALPASIIPDIAEGDTVIVTESFVPHRAFVAWFGIDGFSFTGQAAHRPRIAAIRFE